MNSVLPFYSTNNPLVKAIAKGGPLASSFKRKWYFKEKCKVVEPVKYVLEARSNKTFQYIPFVILLQQLLSCKDPVDKLVQSYNLNLICKCKTVCVF